MTRRMFIYVDNKERKLYSSPEFNGDKLEYARRGAARSIPPPSSTATSWNTPGEAPPSIPAI